MPLYRSATNLLNQLDSVINQLSNSQYAMPLEILGGSSIGQHVRHSVEFFICLIEARDVGIVNYDKRSRNPYIEQEIESATNVIASIKTFLKHRTTDFPICLEACYELDTEQKVSIASTFYRELAYNIEHMIHHMALIKVGVRSIFHHVVLPEHFGIASSTVRYQNLRKTE